MKKLATVLLTALALTACDNSAKVLECLDGCEGPSKEIVTQPAPPATITCKVFDLSSVAPLNTIPNMDVLAPQTTLSFVSLNNPSVGETISLQQLVGTPAESLTTQVGLDCSAQMIVETEGNHVLTLRSDDGSRLTVNGIVVLSHDGLHSYTAKSSIVNLRKGVISLRVEYFQNFGQKGLTLSVRKPGSPFEELIDSSMLK